MTCCKDICLLCNPVKEFSTGERYCYIDFYLYIQMDQKRGISNVKDGYVET